MPVFENSVAFETVQGVKVFLKVEARITRERVAESLRGLKASKASGRSGRVGAQVRKLKQTGQRIAGRGRTFGARARRQLGGGEADGITPENVVWVFGAARTGSTWLARMMGELEGYTVWREPLVGALFGNLYYGRRTKHLIGKAGKHYILGDSHRESWLDSIRTFVLKEATGRFPEAVGPSNYLVVKEPNGSLGAPLLLEALPESRMILLIRDPRDVVASAMDANRKGSWKYENRNTGNEKTETRVDKDPDAFVRDWAKSYLQRIVHTKQAYEAYRGRKVLVRYEELRADTLGTMKRIYSALEIPVDEGKLSQAVEKYSWENIPEEEKGEGKFFRKATPGGWSEDLTPRQVKIVERITAPLLQEFYPA